MRQVLTLPKAILDVLDEYAAWVMDPAHRPDLNFKNWPSKGKFKREGRPEFSTSLDCLKSLTPAEHDGYPPDSYGFDMNDSTITRTMNDAPLTTEEKELAKKYLEKSRWLDDTLGTHLGYKFCALKMYYPPEGYIAWHTNWNVPGYNCIFTYSDGSGYWRHIDSTKTEPGTLLADPDKHLVHLQDKNGWHCKLGYYGKKEEHDRIVWHSAFGGPRITLGFVVYDEDVWTDLVDEITSADDTTDQVDITATAQSLSSSA